MPTEQFRSTEKKMLNQIGENVRNENFYTAKQQNEIHNFLKHKSTNYLCN